MQKDNLNFNIDKLGKCKIDNPIKPANIDPSVYFTKDSEFISYHVYRDLNEKGDVISHKYKDKHLEKAGPREKIFYDPSKVKVGILTAGGLCPGLNDVIRTLVRTLYYSYGVKNIKGFQYGYKGLLAEYGLESINLNPEIVDNIHKTGGTFLGSSRGDGHRTEELVDALHHLDINILFVIGGDGSQKGASAIAEEAMKRKLNISVVGIPKTIDNDLSFTQKSFGFETAVSEAVKVVTNAHVEANSARCGIGLVKLMGRESGFIAAYTSLASNDVNFCLIPEDPFDLDGENGFLSHLVKRLEKNDHAVIVVAEGAGQEFIKEESKSFDESGNQKLKDIGTFLQEKIKLHIQKINEKRDSTNQLPYNLKYIDPSYTIRSLPANAGDSFYCARLASNAVHAAMTGRTNMIVSLWSDKFIHVPIHLATRKRNQVQTTGSLWRDVLSSTRQPISLKNL